VGARPLVSVIINNYNYARFLREAIDSALSQAYCPIEVIVVDDGSSDHSRELIMTYERAVTPVFKENSGQASAFNAGIAASHGDILCFLDSDDYFYAGKVATIVEIAISSNVARPLMIHHRLRISREAGKPGQEEFLGKTHDNPLNLADYARKYKFMYYAAGATTGISITRGLAHLLFPLPENIRVSADDFLVYGASLVGELHFSGEVLGAYRVHGGNLWYANPKPKSTEFWNTLEYYLNQKLKENNLPGKISYAESMWSWWELATERRWTELMWRMIKCNAVQHDLHTLGFTYGICRFVMGRMFEKRLRLT
jgi:glycosyltransferase involved in cell wall biosynthesis